MREKMISRPKGDFGRCAVRGARCAVLLLCVVWLCVVMYCVVAGCCFVLLCVVLFCVFVLCCVVVGCCVVVCCCLFLSDAVFVVRGDGVLWSGVC